MMQPEILNHRELTSEQLFRLLRKQRLPFAGNRRLKIYGVLNCRAGKRIKKQNRVFFTEENQALQAGYRPCAVCQRQAYNAWKERKKQVENGTAASQF